MTGGYTGKILIIDLKNQSTSIEKTNLEDAKNFIGAKGLGAKILLDRLPKDTDPLSPDNILMFTTGPLTNLEMFLAVSAHFPVIHVSGQQETFEKFTRIDFHSFHQFQPEWIGLGVVSRSEPDSFQSNTLADQFFKSQQQLLSFMLDLLLPDP